MNQVAQPSSAMQRLQRRRRRVTWLGLATALLVTGLFLSVHWWQRPQDASKPGKDVLWNPLVSPTGGFSVKLPGTPQKTSRALSLLNHPANLEQYTAPAGDVTYLAGQADAPAGAAVALSPDELIDAARPDFETILGGRIVDARPITGSPFPGREWRLDNGGGPHPLRSIARVYLAHHRLYHLAASGPLPFDQLAPAAAKLFESFQLTPAKQ